MDRALTGSFVLQFANVDTQSETRMFNNVTISDYYRQLTERLREHFNVTTPPYPFAHNEFSAVVAAALALDAADKQLSQRNESLLDFNYERSDMTELFIENLLALDVQGPVSRIRFKENGDLVSSVDVLQYQPGKEFVRVGTFTTELKLYGELVWGTSDGQVPQARSDGIFQSPVIVALAVFVGVVLVGAPVAVFCVVTRIRRTASEAALYSTPWRIEIDELEVRRNASRLSVVTADGQMVRLYRGTPVRLSDILGEVGTVQSHRWQIH